MPLFVRPTPTPPVMAAETAKSSVAELLSLMVNVRVAAPNSRLPLNVAPRGLLVTSLLTLPPSVRMPAPVVIAAPLVAVDPPKTRPLIVSLLPLRSKVGVTPAALPPTTTEDALGMTLLAVVFNVPALTVVLPVKVLGPESTRVPVPILFTPWVLVLSMIPARVTFWPLVSRRIGCPMLLLKRVDQSVPALLAVYLSIAPPPSENVMFPPLPRALAWSASSAAFLRAVVPV